uniref:Uncharacterized protein n=1 Tax=Knipowitschia caucasica TaxID=637954 RepID=A0AAV2LV44_KNICA
MRGHSWERWPSIPFSMARRTSVSTAWLRGPRLGARPTPLRDPGAHNFNPGAGWSSLPDPFPYRAELDLPVPQRRNCAPTPTKKEHRGPSRLKPPLGFPGPIPAPCSRVWKDWSVCVPALHA